MFNIIRPPAKVLLSRRCLTTPNGYRSLSTLSKKMYTTRALLKASHRRDSNTKHPLPDAQLTTEGLNRSPAKLQNPPSPPQTRISPAFDTTTGIITSHKAPATPPSRTVHSVSSSSGWLDGNLDPASPLNSRLNLIGQKCAHVTEPTRKRAYSVYSSICSPRDDVAASASIDSSSPHSWTLDGLSEFLPPHVLDHFKSLPTLTNCPIHVRDLWTACGSTMPQVFDAKLVYCSPTGKRHDYTEIYKQLVETPSLIVGTGSYYRWGWGRARLPPHFFKQMDEACARNDNIAPDMVYPPPRELLYSHRYRSVNEPSILSVVHSIVVRNKELLSGVEGLTSLKNRPSAILWSLRGSFSDIHIDHAEEQIATPVARLHGQPCRKFFFLYPPTTKNLQILEIDHHKPNHASYLENKTLNEVCGLLEGGIQVLLDPSQVLHTPACCPHAALTASAGMMAVESFYHPKTLFRLARYLTTEHVGHVDSLKIRHLFNLATEADTANFFEAWPIVMRDILDKSQLLSRDPVMESLYEAAIEAVKANQHLSASHKQKLISELRLDISQSKSIELFKPKI